MSEKTATYIVDAFVTGKSFSGNPAGVCFLENNEKYPNELKQKIAAELNLPTIAFTWKLHAKDSFKTTDRFGLQWFSPTVQVDLCGHALIALAKVLFEVYENINACVTFETPLSGDVQARKRGNGLFSIEFPNQEPKNIEEEPYANLIKIATQDRAYVDVQFSAPTRKLLIRFDDSMTREEFELLSPSPSAIQKSSQDGSIRGVILTVKANVRNGYTDCDNNGYDFASRYFTPWLGLDEDYVCGSAHAVLGPYWKKILGVERELRARQCSLRGGDLLVNVRNDNRVEISGQCRIILKGQLEI